MHDNEPRPTCKNSKMLANVWFYLIDVLPKSLALTCLWSMKKMTTKQNPALNLLIHDNKICIRKSLTFSESVRANVLFCIKLDIHEFPMHRDVFHQKILVKTSTIHCLSLKNQQYSKPIKFWMFLCIKSGLYEISTQKHVFLLKSFGEDFQY